MPEVSVVVPQSFDLRSTLAAMTAKAVGRLPAETGVTWWVTRTRSGPASLRLCVVGDAVQAAAWGDGAEEVLAGVPALLGADDDPDSFAPGPGLVRDLHRRRRGLRLGRTGRIFEALLPAILGQRVTSVEAKRAYRAIVRRYGSKAPGPIDAWVPPAASTLAQIDYADLHSLGVERSRAIRIVEAARRGNRLEEATTMDPAAARTRLMGVRGIGEWTAAIVLGAALGDPDAVPVGDYHIPNMVSWALAGEPRGDDARMLELLEPYRGHRRRVLILLKQSGISAPKYGPKLAPRDFRAS